MALGTTAKLQDCQIHGCESPAELLIVEGNSASKAVLAVRDPRFQAVLPMQGKPMNAHKSSWKAVQRYDWFDQLLRALGYGNILSSTQESLSSVSPNACRYSRIILLFDPDADGIHCGALMILFFHRILPGLLEAGVVCLARAPLYRFDVVSRLSSSTQSSAGSQYSDPGNQVDSATASAGSHSPDHSRVLYAYSDTQGRRGIMNELRAEGYRFARQFYRGLASMERETLLSTCVDPSKRQIYRLGTEDAQAAISVFGGS